MGASRHDKLLDFGRCGSVGLAVEVAMWLMRCGTMGATMGPFENIAICVGRRCGDEWTFNGVGGSGGECCWW